jgi:hypothetical protein
MYFEILQRHMGYQLVYLQESPCIDRGRSQQDVTERLKLTTRLIFSSQCTSVGYELKTIGRLVSF